MAEFRAAAPTGVSSAAAVGVGVVGVHAQMSIRFRYRDRDGKEVAVAGLNELRVEIREGRVRDSTPLFDGDTGIFAPASEHAPYRFLAEVVAKGGRDSPDLLPVKMTLTAEREADPAEALEELRKELAREAEARGETLRVNRYNPSFEELDDDLEAEAPGDARPDDPAPPEGTARVPAAGEARPSEAVRAAAPLPAEVEVELPTFVRGAPRARPAPGGPGVRRIRRRFGGTAAAAAVVLTVAAGLWAVMTDGALPRTADAGPVLSPVNEAGPPGAEGGLAVETEAEAGVAGGERFAVPSPGGVPLAATEGAAFQHMVQGIDSLARLFGVTAPPAAWLGGRYLADAQDYPDVAAYWERYLAFAGAVRGESEVLFRRGFVRELEARGVSPAVVSMRVAEALPRFRQEARGREEVFQGMTALGRKALTLHDLLVLRSDELAYDPMAGSTVAGDAVLGIAVDDEDLRESVWLLMDGIFDELELLHGQARWSRDELAEGMVRGGLSR